VKAADRVVWLDMEMTGLDPESCVPLEVAVIVTDSELVELASYETVVIAPSAALEQMIDLVRDMHTQNGLLERVAAAEVSCVEADAAMVALVDAWCEPRTGVLAGNSIWQDRRFIRRYFPRLDAALHYRMIDVSTIKELARRWYGEAALAEKDSPHTAMADIRASIAELVHYRDTLFRPAEEK
jgi:oligoribonuclease